MKNQCIFRSVKLADIFYYLIKLYQSVRGVRQMLTNMKKLPCWNTLLSLGHLADVAC